MAIGTNLLLINGVIDTDNTIAQNIEELSLAAGCWTTFDVNTGKWSVILQQEGPSTSSFDDSNIIGAITVSGSGTSDVYNTATISFPNKDVFGNRDTSLYQLPDNEWYEGEVRNTISMNFNLCNDPIQVGMIAMRELRQSRLDKIIKFNSDFTKLNVRAGDIIDVTSSMHGFDKKLFRVISIEETDGDDGGIQLSFTALEYSDLVYNYSDLQRVKKYTNTGIPAKANNEQLIAIDQKAYEQNLLTTLQTDPKVVDPMTGLSTGLGILSLLNLVDGLMKGDTGEGGLFSAIADLIKGLTGIDPTTPPAGDEVLTPEEVKKTKDIIAEKEAQTAQTESGACSGNIGLGYKGGGGEPTTGPTCGKPIPVKPTPETKVKPLAAKNGKIKSGTYPGPYYVEYEVDDTSKLKPGDSLVVSGHPMYIDSIEDGHVTFVTESVSGLMRDQPMTQVLPDLTKSVDMSAYAPSKQLMTNESPSYTLEITPLQGSLEWSPYSGGKGPGTITSGYSSESGYDQDNTFYTNNPNFPIRITGDYDQINNSLANSPRWFPYGGTNDPARSTSTIDPPVTEGKIMYKVIPSNGGPSSTYYDTFVYERPTTR